MDVNYWYKSYSDKVKEFEKTVDNAVSKQPLEQAIHACEKLSSKAEKEKRSLEHEVRLLKDHSEKESWKEKISEMQDRMAAAKRNLKTKQQQGELFGDGKKDTFGQGHQGPTNDEYLDKAEETHDKIEDTLGNVLNVVNETEDLGSATLEQLAKQRDQIKDIHKTVLNIDDALNRSDALIRTFSKRMATDKIIQLFFMLNVLIFIGMIVYLAMNGTSSDDDDGGAKTTDDAPTDDTTARRLLRW
mmetsp:Transcript_13472/g.16043  ORF Transcript_13472/g.16043 Transcript_13472/m.16043 type:complete len:244 (-) Transcript_13472:18-749(-)